MDCKPDLGVIVLASKESLDDTVTPKELNVSPRQELHDEGKPTNINTRLSELVEGDKADPLKLMPIDHNL